MKVPFILMFNGKAYNFGDIEVLQRNGIPVRAQIEGYERKESELARILTDALADGSGEEVDVFAMGTFVKGDVRS